MGCIFLCKGKKAESPYVVANIRKKLYTIEELCFYIYDNPVLCGEELLNPRLTHWIGSQCGFADLCDSILIILNKDPRPERVASQIFAYTDYLEKSDREAVCERIRKYSQFSVNERKKMCADHHVVAGRYSEAIRDYEEMLLEVCYENEKERHHILYDIGCCYGAMFYYELAYDWFMKAAETDIQKEEDIQAALFCKKMVLREEEFSAFIKEHDEWEQAAYHMEQNETHIRREYEERPQTVSLYKELRQAETDDHLHEAIEKRLTAYKAEI